MGWTSISTDQMRGLSPGRFLIDEWKREPNFELVGIEQVGTTFYLAVRRKADGDQVKTPYVFGVVTITDDGIIPRRPSTEFAWKDVDEVMGPNESECPRAILELLTRLDKFPNPDRNGHAQAWRDRCWENVRKREAAAAPA